MISRFSIAVLPFTNTNQEKDGQFLADGLTMEIIHALSRYDILHVTSRFSSARFSKAKKTISDIREKLGVHWLVDGNIRISGEQLTVMVQLITTKDGLIANSFSEQGSFNKTPALLENLASAIAIHIKANTDPVRVSEKLSSVSSAATEEFMKGQYLLNQLDSGMWEQMIGHFKQSLDLDPDYPYPMVALCQSYTWLSSIGVVDPLEARKEIDELIQGIIANHHQVSDVYQLQAEKLFWINWKPVLAMKNLNTALELNPSNSSALVMKGLVLASMGRIDESLDVLFRAERLNPYGENVKYCIGMIYRYIGDFDKAYVYILESLEISPNWLAPYFTMFEVLSILHRFDEIAAFKERSMSVPGFSYMIPVFDGLAAAYANKREEALDIVDQITNSSKPEKINSSYYNLLAMICLKLEKKEEALGWIEMGLKFRSASMLFIHIDCSWDPLKENPRFKKLKGSSGLPEPENSSPPPPLRYGRSQLGEEIAASIQQALKTLLDEKEVFLDSKLSLSDLAEGCEVSPNQLSQYINAYLGKSYYDYLNRFRLDYFLKISRKREFENLSILGLAYESGFNSKTTFNTFFKREMKLTPKEFLKRDVKTG